MYLNGKNRRILSVGYRGRMLSDMDNSVPCSIQPVSVNRKKKKKVFKPIDVDHDIQYQISVQVLVLNPTDSSVPSLCTRLRAKKYL